MAAAIGVYDRPVTAPVNGLDRCIEHGIDELCVWTPANGPANYHSIKAVDHR